MRTQFISVVLMMLTSVVANADTQGVLRAAELVGEHDESADTELDKRIWVISQAENGDIWFGSNGGGAYRYDGDSLTRYGRDDGLAGRQVRDIKSVPGGDVLVSTNSGVFLFDGESFSRVEEKHARTPDDGWRLSDDDVWVVYKPGEHGPSRYDGEVLHVLNLPESPYNEMFADDRDNPPFPVDGIYSIYKDSRGHVWFGTAVGGLCRYDGESLHWMYEERLTTTPSGGSFGIRSIYEDVRGDFWICNTRHRYRFSAEPAIRDGEPVLAYERKPGLPDSQTDSDTNFTYFHGVAEDEQGAIWMVCGDEGLLVHSDESTKRYGFGSGVYAVGMLCDSEGRIWVGSLESGVFVFDGDGFERFTGS
ncbi:MAG: hypothetical protein ED559_00930 [Phycisphaera sp.]|nr:MAG: hypothetical protein ED559_00930 [Phycisphaera sp.]